MRHPGGSSISAIPVLAGPSDRQRGTKAPLTMLTVQYARALPGILLSRLPLPIRSTANFGRLTHAMTGSNRTVAWAGYSGWSRTCETHKPRQVGADIVVRSELLRPAW
jgi:hypothetical protein